MTWHAAHVCIRISTAIVFGAESDAAGSKFYVLRSLVPRNWKQKFIAEPEQSPSRHLLVILLMLIKCQGDKLSDGMECNSFSMSDHILMESSMVLM